jgi:hypothetical protein
MSYDVSIIANVCSSCGRSEEIYEGNMTSNVSGMWTAALGFPLRFLDGARCCDALPYLEKAESYLNDSDNHELLLNMEPANKWGSIGSARKFIHEIREGCIDAMEVDQYHSRITVHH